MEHQVSEKVKVAHAEGKLTVMNGSSNDVAVSFRPRTACVSPGMTKVFDVEADADVSVREVAPGERKAHRERVAGKSAKEPVAAATGPAPAAGYGPGVPSARGGAGGAHLIGSNLQPASYTDLSVPIETNTSLQTARIENAVVATGDARAQAGGYRALTAGDVVLYAQQQSGMTVDSWNATNQPDRETRINAALLALHQAAAKNYPA